MKDMVTRLDVGNQFCRRFDLDIYFVIVDYLKLDLVVVQQRRLGIDDGQSRNVAITDSQVSQANDAGI